MASTSVWGLLKHLKFESIFFKNFIVIMLLIVIPLVGIIWGVYAYSYNLMIGEISTFCLGELKSKQDAFDLLTTSIGLSSIALSLNKKVQLFLINDERSFFDYNPYELREILNILELSNEYLQSIYLFRDNDNYVITASRESGFISGFLDKSWLKVYQERADKLLTGPWVISRTAVDPYQNSYPVISVINPVYIINDMSSGAIIFNLNVNKIKEVIMTNQNIEGSKTHIINDTGELIFSNNFSLIDKNIEEIQNFNLTDNNISKLITVDKEKYILSVVESEFYNWKYVSISPLEFFQNRIANLGSFITLIIIISLFVVIIVSGLISYKTYRPVHNLVNYVEHPEDWEKLKNNERTHSQIVNVFRKIRRYINMSSNFQDVLFNKLTILKRSQLTALQSHINPHFLFNTLDTVKWLAMGLTKSNNNVSKIVAALARLLREEIDTEHNLIPLEKEIEYLKLYLYIQGFRYKDKFKVKWDVRENLFNKKIVKISLQPLVENAIYHGIKPKEGSGIIKIRADSKKDLLIIKIIDNGVGISSGRLKELNEMLKEEYYSYQDHLGLKNVNQRIKIIFGDEYGVYLYSKKGKGTVTTVVLPVI